MLCMCVCIIVSIITTLLTAALGLPEVRGWGCTYVVVYVCA